MAWKDLALTTALRRLADLIKSAEMVQEMIEQLKKDIHRYGYKSFLPTNSKSRVVRGGTKPSLFCGKNPPMILKTMCAIFVRFNFHDTKNHVWKFL